METIKQLQEENLTLRHRVTELELKLEQNENHKTRHSLRDAKLLDDVINGVTEAVANS